MKRAHASTMAPTAALLATIVVAVALSCNTAFKADQCNPGDTQDCLCEDGSVGHETCRDSGRWGPCDCTTDDPVPCTEETAAEVCGEDPCVDGYCCDGPCDGLCEACNLSGFEGVCTFIPSGQDPDDECGTCQTCDGEGGCGSCGICQECDALGECVAVAEGEDPNDDCDVEEPTTCGTTGECDGASACEMYVDVDCNDEDVCTIDDTCNGLGACEGALIDCSGHGTCNGSSGSPECDCDEGYVRGTDPTTCLAPEIVVTQDSTELLDGSGVHAFGVVTADGDGGSASTAVVFTIENAGTADLAITGVSVSAGDTGDFDLDSGSTASSLAPSATTTFTVTFDPLTAGDKEATVTITNDDFDENPFTFTVNGRGSDVPVPDINVRQGSTDLVDGAGSHTFTSTLADGDGGTAGSYVTFTIENTGTADLTISGASLSAGHTGDFDLDTGSMASTVAAAGSTTFRIRFDPVVAGTRTATVSIANNDSDENPYTFTVTGEGLAPEIDVTDPGGTSIPDGSGSHSFGSTPVGSPTSYATFTIHNRGTANLTVSSVTDDSGHFDTQDDTSSPVSAGASTTFRVRFDPTSPGSRTATVTIANNDSDENPYTFTVSGTGTAPEIDVRQGSTSIPDGSGSYSFGSTMVGSPTSYVTFTIHNVGTAPLTVSGVTDNSTHFDTLDDTSSPVSAGGSTTFRVRFDPTSVGAKSGTVSITNNDSDENPYTFTVSGTGTASIPDVYMYDGGTFSGSPGGYTNLDLRCRSTMLSGCGTSVPFISASSSYEIRDIPARLGLNTSATIVGPTGTKIADNWADLLDGTIDTTLSSAGVFTSSQFWYSGSNTNGSLHAANCTGWTSTTILDGRYGRNWETGVNWISIGNATCGASTYHYLCLCW